MDNITRVAGIIEFYEGKEEISIETLKFSYSLCMRYSKHFLTYLAGEPTVVVNANTLARFLLEKCDKENSTPAKDFKPFEYKNIQIREGKTVEFNQTDIVARGPYSLRNSKNDHAVFKNALELLIRMGYVGKMTERNYDQYKFSESLIFSTRGEDIHQLEVPMLKNGNEYTIESLPLFDDLMPYLPPEDSYSFKRYNTIIYCIKET
jgi:hypothetical protein